MAGRAAETAGVAVLAAIVTVAIAMPVLRAPSERVFGAEIAGRHHDPFTVMQRFERPLSVGVYSQPVTDVPGALLARVSGAVAAYNWLVLLSFPLAAVAAYLLARDLALSPAAAAVVAMAFAFSPFHLAQAAYHPHVAQVQWVPLYFLALWRCLRTASPTAVAWLSAATAAVTLSNFYAGFIAAVITPVAVAAYWLAVSRREPGATRRLAVTAASLLFVAASGLAYAWYTAGPVIASRGASAFPRADLFRYSAKWWSYLVPPIENPLLGAAAGRIWTAAGVREGLLEQQVALGWGIVVLGLIAVSRWLVHDRRRASIPGLPNASILAVPVLVIVAVTALVCSLSPERTIGPFTFVRPSAFLYDVAPMFRSYARFGVVVQLMAALLAGIGVEYLRRAGTTRARIVCAALVVLAAGEYAVSPWNLSRDVLPTRAHRWVVLQPGRVQALDCAPLTQESASVQWLTEDRVTLLGGPIGDCTEPDLPGKLAANGYTHLLVRRGIAVSQSFDDRAPPAGFRLAARFADARVFEVTEDTPRIYTAALKGFYLRETDGPRSWRWMGADAAWTIVNTGGRSIIASLDVDLEAFHHPRALEVWMDGRHVRTVIVEPLRRLYQLGPLTVGPGYHDLTFRSADAPTIASEASHAGDRRLLSFALGAWSWTVRSEPP